MLKACPMSRHAALDVHYPFLLFMLIKAFLSPTSSLLLDRLGLADPGIHTLCSVSASFAGYNAVESFAKQCKFDEIPLTKHQPDMVRACFSRYILCGSRVYGFELHFLSVRTVVIGVSSVWDVTKVKSCLLVSQDGQKML